MAKPIGPEICVFRGDTEPLLLHFTNTDGSDTDLTGWTLVLTTNTEEEPTDDSNEIFQVAAVIAAPTSGIVSFTLSSLVADALTPGDFFYDLQREVSGAKKTLFVGAFVVLQDINKA